MRAEVCNCDVCGKERGATNHWFLGHTFVKPVFGAVLEFSPWNDVVARAHSVKHICSEQCSHVHLSRFLKG